MGLNMSGDQGYTDSVGQTSGDIKYDNTVSFGGALGLRLTKNVRIEGEVSYRNPDVSSLDIDNQGNFDSGANLKNWLGLMNVYYDFDFRGKLKPYISAGLGFGHYDATVNGSATGPSFAESTTAFTYQAGAGLSYQLNPTTALTGGYRYLDSLDLDFGNVEVDYSSHEFLVGLRYDLDWK